MYLRAQPTEGGLRIQSYSHSLTTEFMGDWSPATPTGLNTSSDYQPDGLVVRAAGGLARDIDEQLPGGPAVHARGGLTCLPARGRAGRVERAIARAHIHTCD